jgi:hypothetical protein
VALLNLQKYIVAKLLSSGLALQLLSNCIAFLKLLKRLLKPNLAKQVTPIEFPGEAP